MHVLIIAQYFPPDMGGGATRAYNIAKGLVLNGCKVTVITAAPHYPHGNIPRKYRWKPLVVEYKEKMRIIRTLMPPISSIGLLNRVILFTSFMISSLFALFIVRKVDVIWAANPNILSFFPALIYSLVKKSPVVLNADDLWPEDLYNLGLIKKESIIFRLGEILARIAYHKSEAITPISPGYTKVITKKYKVKTSKIHVVRAGVDITKFKPMKYQRRNDKFIIVYSGAFSLAYDFDQILEAAKILQKKDKQILFVIQGGGEQADRIKMKTRKLRLKNVIIIDSILTREKVAQLLNIADVLILPLRDFGRPYLGISSKLYEYQAVGKPIICVAKGQPAEYIKETNSGIVVAPGDYKSLAEAILYLKENRDIAEKLGKNGRKYIENNMSISKIGLRMREIFESILIRSRRG